VDIVHLVVLCTCPDRDSAVDLAQTAVNQRLAACVNIVPGIASVYRWQEKIETDEELLLLIKTRSDIYPALEQTIRSRHPYEVPEIIALPIERGLGAYLGWMDDSLGS
jgi:periplasmic divalent cation tolerance protein